MIADDDPGTTPGSGTPGVPPGPGINEAEGQQTPDLLQTGAMTTTNPLAGLVILGGLILGAILDETTDEIDR